MLVKGSNMWLHAEGREEKYGVLTACLSAPLPEDEHAEEAPEGSSLPTRRVAERGGYWGCSYLLHRLISGEFVVAGGGCRSRKCESMNYLMLSKCGEVMSASELAPGLLCSDNGPVSCLDFFSAICSVCCSLTELLNNRFGAMRCFCTVLV